MQHDVLEQFSKPGGYQGIKSYELVEQAVIGFDSYD